MTASFWSVDAIGTQRVDDATTEASRRRLRSALNLNHAATEKGNDELRLSVNVLEVAVFDLLDDPGRARDLKKLSADAFQIARTLPVPLKAEDRAHWLLHVACLGILGDRASDVRRFVMNLGIPELPVDSPDWGIRNRVTIVEIWLRLLRKNGWDDLDAVQNRVIRLREDQKEQETSFLRRVEEQQSAAPAWRLIAEYHLAKAAETLARYLSEGFSDGRYDIRQQLEAQFDRAVVASARSLNPQLEVLARLLGATSKKLVENSIWTVTRAVNSRVTKFVHEVLSRSRKRPIFEMLPPQTKTLRDEGLLGSSLRSVVVSLPTSSGKTLIAEFRILQALNQFDDERGWVAYLAPTRALVNQLTVRLRRDFGPLGVIVERVSPALEIDGLETSLLVESDGSDQFRILVTTPEKLDLILRSGWEDKIKRPLTLVVVDEAHGIGGKARGVRLELLLATINRECRYAQFLLLTPFIHNTDEIASWLAPDSHKSIELGLDWSPNDRAIAIATPKKGVKPGDFTIQIETRHTSKNTLAVPEALDLPQLRPLALTWSAVANSPGKLAAATAELLSKRGSVIVLSDKPRNTWAIAETLKARSKISGFSPELANAKQFFAYEFGEDFPLCELLEYGVAVHHSGMSDDARALVEWLVESGDIQILVATTTIANGVNFPVSGIVFASHQYPYGQDMPPEDFWNVAGRAGRVDQEDLGIVALAAPNINKKHALRDFIDRSVGALNSTLVEMVQTAIDQGNILHLESIAWQPEWSSFLQYLAHTYRQLGEQRFASEVEQVLRGTLGFQTLRRIQPQEAAQLLQGVTNYGARLLGKPLKLVDSTGFSWESVSNTLSRLAQQSIKEEVWRSDLFDTRRPELAKLMGILLSVPELRENLAEVFSGTSAHSDKLARIVSDWVNGRSLQDLAKEYYVNVGNRTLEPTDAMTKCCQSVFGRLTQTASWGLSALQTLTLGDKFDGLPESQQRTLRNLPARIYYGVGSDEAIALRMLGVPRMAAQMLSEQLQVTASESLPTLRRRLRDAGPDPWTRALGESGSVYRRVWEIIEGIAS